MFFNITKVDFDVQLLQWKFIGFFFSFFYLNLKLLKAKILYKKSKKRSLNYISIFKVLYYMTQRNLDNV